MNRILSLVAAALFLWIVHGITANSSDQAYTGHHYGYLVDGFLAGTTHLSLPPPKELLALPDPFDPAANLPYRLWDASLYHDQYYLYYGTTPALLFMLPWKLLSGEQMPQWLAAWLAASIGFAGLALLLTRLRDAYYPATRRSTLCLAIVVCAHVSWLPVILRRPAFWELPIITAVALFWWALYFLWRHFRSGFLPQWGMAAGTTFALAASARPTYLPIAAGVGIVLACLAPRSRRICSLRSFGIPLAVVLIGMAIYNYARFGDVLEFGQKYQLWALDERTLPHFSLGYVPFNARVYFFSLPEMSPYFPFFRTIWPGSYPPGYIATEEMPGLIFSLPILLSIFLLYPVLRWRTEEADQRPLRLTLCVSLISTAIAGVVLLCFAGATSRYIVELLGGVTPAVGVALLGAPRGVIARTLLTVAGAWTILCVWLASFEFRDVARTTQPGVYNPIARLLNYPSHWYATQRHLVFGPIAFDVQIPEAAKPGSTSLVSAGRMDRFNELLIDVESPDRVRFRLKGNGVDIAQTPYFQPEGRTVSIAVQAPWLFPPAAHPYWDSYSDAAERTTLQSVFGIELGDVWYAQRSPWTFDSASLEPYVPSAVGSGPVVVRLVHAGVGVLAAPKQ